MRSVQSGFRLALNEDLIRMIQIGLGVAAAKVALGQPLHRQKKAFIYDLRVVVAARVIVI